MKIIIGLIILLASFVFAKEGVAAADKAGAGKSETPADMLKGYPVPAVTPGSVWAELGFKDGDVLKTVNGRPITTKDDTDILANTLKSGGRLRIEVLRGGKTEILHFAAPKAKN